MNFGQRQMGMLSTQLFRIPVVDEMFTNEEQYFQPRPLNARTPVVVNLDERPCGR